MKKWGKRTLVAGGIAAALMLAAVLCIPAFFDIRQYKPQIEAQISRGLGLPVYLKGDLEVSLFPWIGFSAAELCADNPPGFEEKEFFRIRVLEARLEFLPLLSKKIRVGRIVLQEPVLVLEKNADGRGNWETLGKKRESEDSPSESEDKSAGPRFAAFSIDAFSIGKGRVLWIDAEGKSRRDISDLNLQIKDISAENSVPFSLSAQADGQAVRLDGSIGPQEKGKGKIPFVFSCSAAQLPNLHLSGYAENLLQSPSAEIRAELAAFSPRKFLTAWNIPLDLPVPEDRFAHFAFKGRIKGNADSVSVEEGEAEVDASRLSFSFRADHIQTLIHMLKSGTKENGEPNPSLVLGLKADRFEPEPYFLQKAQKNAGTKTGSREKTQMNGQTSYESLLHHLEMSVTAQVGRLKTSLGLFENADLTFRSREGKAELDIASERNGRALSLKTLAGPLKKGNLVFESSLVSQDLRAEIKGRLAKVFRETEADMSLTLAAFSPRKLLHDFQIPFPVKGRSSETFEKMSFSGNIKAGKNALAVSRGRLLLDSSVLDFSFQGRNLSASPDIRFEGTLDRVDINPYLPPEDNAGTGAEISKSSEAEAVNYAPFRKLSLEGGLRVGHLRAGKTQMQNLTLRINARKGVFRIDPFTANLYEGRMQLRGTGDLRENVPVADLFLDVQGLQVHPLLADILEKDFLEGRTLANIRLGWKGDRPEQIRENLDGEGTVLFTDGAIRGIDLGKMVRNIDRAFDTGLLQGASGNERTDFSELEGRFDIQKGLVNISDISFVSPFLRAAGSGTADLKTEKLDFRLRPEFVATVTAKGDPRQHKGVMFPVIISGTFDKAVFLPDLRGIIRMVPKERVTEILKDPEKGLDTLRDTLGDILKTGKKKEKKEPEEKEKSAAPAEEKIGDFLKKLPFGQ